MSRIPEDEIERVKRGTDLAALIRSRGIVLEEQGRNLVGRCPFHNEGSRGNLIVTPAKGLWRCMSSQCGRAGNAIQFVQHVDGVSFRHAFEILAGGRGFEHPHGARGANGKAVGRSRSQRLPCPVESSEEDDALLAKVSKYYAERLAGPEGAAGRGMLEKRGLGDAGLLERFGAGLSDRSLGLRIPNSRTMEGKALRERLKALGVYRANGREHLNGCIVVPVRDPGSGAVCQLYGRRIDPKARKEMRHLFLARPQAGIFNFQALESREIILCEGILDAMTFVAHGMEAATCLYSAKNLSGELLEAIRSKGVESVRIAFDADDAGDEAARLVSEKLQSHGIECLRVKFPLGADANGYAVEQGGGALRRAVRSAQWLGSGSTQKSAASPVPEAPEAEEGEASGESPRAPSSLAAEAARKEKSSPSQPLSPAKPERKGEWWEVTFGDRRWRAGGVEKNGSLESLKVTLRLSLEDGSMHADQLDLWKASDRRRFVEAASEECRLERDLVKRDLGRLLLAFEELQEQRLAGPEEGREEGREEEAVELSPERRAAALEFARRPGLLKEISRALADCGLVGEEVNGLALYLVFSSRLLPKPLAAMIQSTSAAGKTTLLEAVLALFPEEEVVKYSAMTGQSLYYMGEKSLKRKILAIVEEEGAEKASYALKLLQSEGELTIASTGKNPSNGRMETQEYHTEGPASIAATTTSVEVDEEFMNRCLVLGVDESREQTRRIQQAQREAETPGGVAAAEERGGILELMQDFQRVLEPVKVANPHATGLTFCDDRTRTRRDHMKYLGLIKAVALLHQHQRPRTVVTAKGGRKVEMLLATLDDIEAANAVAPELLGRSLDELPPQSRRLLEEAKALVRERMEARDCSRREALFTRRDLRERLGWSVTQVKAHLDRLQEHEYLWPRHGRMGAAFSYELLVDAEAAPGTWHVGLIDVAELRSREEQSGEEAA